MTQTTPFGGKPLKHFTLEDCVTALASDEAAPGAGAAGGIALALAAACASKAVAVTRAHQAADGVLAKLQTLLEHISKSALNLAEHDAVQFMQQLQSQSPVATNELLRTDYTIVDTCRALDSLLESHAHLIANNMVGDWKAARALNDACLFIQLANVRELKDGNK